MITVESDSEADKDWNNRLLNSEVGNIHQTKEMAASKRLKGNDALFLKFIDGKGQIVGQLMLLLYSRFKKRGTVGKILEKIPGISDVIYKWAYGPVVFDSKFIPEIRAELRNFLISNRCKVWGTEHPLANQILSEFTKPFNIKRESTFLLNLNQSREVLWKKMDKHSVRKNIERSQTRGVVVKEMLKPDFLLYCKMTRDLGKVQDISISIAEKQWDILKKVGYTGFFAYENDVPVGGIAIGYFNGYINEFNIIRTERDSLAKLYSQDLLKWKIIEWAIQKGYKYYDLSGVNPNPTTEKELGIFRYKKKWGGDLVNYHLITN